LASSSHSLSASPGLLLWCFISGTPLSAVGSATWLDQGKPWAFFTLEDVVYNVDIQEYIRQKGK
jgi:hypothetical protein